jgi:hypothetical protein|tara:strand:+ start:3320 stop:3586 length:267 start_codon:yes stop_codon:yes gene_type:complete
VFLKNNSIGYKMIKLNITKKDYNKIKFKTHHDQLRLIRHEYSNYDSVINDTNWKYVTAKFVNQIAIHFPVLINAAKQWAEYKTTNFVR